MCLPAKKKAPHGPLVYLGFMAEVCIVGKDWGFFATTLSEQLSIRGIQVRRRYAPNESLSDPHQPAIDKSFAFLKRQFRSVRKPLWVHKSVRRLANLASLIWWTTGLRGSKVVVVSAVPTTFQTAIFMNLCRALGKKVVLCVHGTDGRPPFLNGLYYRDAQVLGAVRFAKYVRQFQRKVSLAVSKSSAVISWMGASHYIPGRTFLFEETGFPVVDESTEMSLATSRIKEEALVTKNAFRVLHAPSSRGKGSVKIKQVIEELTKAGYPFELVEVIDTPNRQVREEIAKSDLVVDQVYSDNFSGVLAREAASGSRWVLVGGDSLDVMRGTSWELPPVLLSSADHLKKDLIWCLTNRDLLKQKARNLNLHFQNRNFAEFFISHFLTTGFSDSPHAALKTRAPFSDFNPGFGGYGLPSEIREMIQLVIQTAGTGGLGFSQGFSEDLLAHYEIELASS